MSAIELGPWQDVTDWPLYHCTKCGAKWATKTPRANCGGVTERNRVPCDGELRRVYEA